MANNVRENRIDDSSLTYITEEFHLANERSKLREGDLLTVQTGFIGVSCLVPKEYEGANTHALIITRLDNKKTDSRFICQFINSALGQKGIKQIQTVGGRPHLNTGDFKHYVVPLPTLPEQRRIADILSTWDTAIEQTKKLIDAKGKRKHGLMQQLLTGKKRFQEFEGQDWQRVRIADLFEEVWRYEKWDENALYNLVSIRRRGGGLFSRGALLGQQIKVKKLKSLRTGDFLISKRQVVHGAWGLVSSEYNGTMVSDEYDSLVVKNPNQLSVEFFTHLSRLPLIRRMAALACNGVHIEKLIFDWDDFSKNLISIPSSMEEQRRISAVLDSCNKEIELLQQQLDALKRQKRGLMQKLLTGQIRVKVDDLEAAVVEAG
jgi:type I restriction enzyme S subunit